MNTQGLLALDSALVSNAYYDETTRHSHMDSLVYNNRSNYSFNTLALGASISITIQNQDFISNTFLAMRFPGVTAIGGNIMNTVPLIAYHVIDSIEISVAGSSPYQQTGAQMLHNILNNCDSKSKRDEIIKMGGGASVADFSADTTYYAFIDVPWASISNINPKLPLDTGLFNQPIQLTIYLKRGADVYFQTGGTGLTIPTSLISAEVQVRLATLKDQSKRLKLKTMKTGLGGEIIEAHEQYAYPFYYKQNSQSAVFSGLTVGTGKNELNISGFRKGALQGIRFSMYNSSTDPLAYNASASTNILKTENPLNFELLYNGLTLYRSIYDSWKMENLLESNSDNWEATTPYGTAYYSVYVNMVDLLPKLSENIYQEGVDLSNQTLAIRLNTPTTNNYRFLLTYVYHAHLVADGNNGEFVL